MKANLTEDEKKVMVNLRDAFNAFIALPVAHIDDLQEFKEAIHKCQNLLAYRVARRVDPEIWK